MSVPAWPIPIQKTKFVMSKAHPTVLFRPNTPMPVLTSYATQAAPIASAVSEVKKQANHPAPGHVFSGRATSSVISLSAGSPSIHRRDRGPGADSAYACVTDGVIGSGLRPVPDLRQVADARPGSKLFEDPVAARAPMQQRHAAVQIREVSEDDGLRGADVLACRLDVAVGWTAPLLS